MAAKTKLNEKRNWEYVEDVVTLWFAQFVPTFAPTFEHQEFTH
jgi:hypothetical protein